MGYAKSIYYTKTSFYNRYMRKGSAVNKYYKNMIELVLKARTVIMKALDLAWDGNKEYKKAYEEQTLGLTFAAINNEFYKDSKSTIIEKYKNIRNICNSDEIRNVIQILERKDLRSKLILKKRVFILCVIAKILNIKHGR